ncbi:Ipo9 [Symbiodinium pilosum]|uniref:Ipo9 protein n=1 Tax=Symbiodinium pilosum TaxID=2952 RepID=A0A812K1B4_SYMPI|nr:Ipo9 [Symbiodinium pilosum]
MAESIEGLLRPACLLVQSLHPAYEQAVVLADDNGQSEEEGGVAPFVAQTMELIQAMAVRAKLKPLLKNRVKSLLQLLVPFMRITENQASTWRADPNEFLVQEEDEHCRGCTIRLSGEGLVCQMLETFKRESSRSVAALATELLERGESGRGSGDAAAWKLTEVGLFIFSIAVGEATVKSLQRSELGPMVPNTLALAARLCADRSSPEFLRARAFSLLHRLGDTVSQLVREEIPQLLEAAAKGLGSDEPLVVRVSACRVFCRFLTALHDNKLQEELLLKGGVLASLGSLLRDADEELLHLCLECMCIIVKRCPTVMAAVSHELCPLTVQIWRRCAADPMVHMQVLDLVSCCVSADKQLQGAMEESLLPVVANDLQGSDPHLASSAIELLGVLLKRAAVPFGPAMCSCVAPLVAKAMDSDESMMLQNACETLVSLVERSPSQVVEAGLLEPLLRLVERLLGPDLEAIGNIIAQKNPDLIALQEMTAEHWQECLKSEAFRRYSWSPAPPHRYFTMLGSRLPVKTEPARHPFKASRMQRDLVTMIVEPSGLPPLAFATSHLESLDEHEARRVQINESLTQLAIHADAVFCGDTNINEAVDGNVKLPRNWEDAWLVLKPDDPGYTFDVERNSMMSAHDGWARANKARLRFDRFWMKMSNYAATDIELLDEPIKDGLWPSDHFGLLLTLQEWRQNRGDQKPVGLLRALVTRLARAERLYLRQELVVVCARLIHEDLNGAVSALAGIEVQSSPPRSGLELLLGAWLSCAPDIRAKRARNVTISAMCRLHEQCFQESPLRHCRVGEAPLPDQLLRVIVAGLECENERCKRLREAEAEALKSDEEEDDEDDEGDEPAGGKGGKFLSDFLDLEGIDDSDGSDAGGDTFQELERKDPLAELDLQSTLAQYLAKQDCQADRALAQQIAKAVQEVSSVSRPPLCANAAPSSGYMH